MSIAPSAGDAATGGLAGPAPGGSFGRASPAMRKAYPPERRMTGPQLAVPAAPDIRARVPTRPDGRAHAAPTLFSIYAEAFWLPTLGAAARLANVRAHPWLALSIIEGEHDTPRRGAHRGPGRGADDRSG